MLLHTLRPNKHKLVYNNTVKKNYYKKTIQNLTDSISKHNIQTVTMGFADYYGRLTGKKYDADYFVEVIIKF